MAGIDKTYVTCWEDYKAAYDWALSVGTVTDDFGNIFAPFDWMAEWEEAEFKESIEAQKERYRNYYKDPKHVQEAKDALGEDWEPDKEGIGELTLWNTPTYFDIVTAGHTIAVSCQLSAVNSLNAAINRNLHIPGDMLQ